MKNFVLRLIIIFLIVLITGNSLKASLPVNYSSPEIGEQINNAQKLINTNSMQSLNLALNALDLSTNQKDDAGIIESCRIIGDNYINQANYKKAFNFLTKALKKANETHNDEQKAKVLNSLGQFYLVLDQYPSSIENFNQAVKLSQDSHSDVLQALATSNLASAYQKSGNIDLAEKLLNESLKNMKDKKLPSIEAADYQTLGNIARSRKKYQDALTKYDKAYTYYQSSNDNKGQLNTLLEIGKTYLAQDDAPKAEYAFEDVLQRSRKLDYPNLEMECYAQLAEVFILENYPLRALENYRNFIKIRDKSESGSKQLVITQINSQQAIEAKEKSIEELTMERDRIESINRWRNGLFIVLATLLPIIIAISLRLFVTLGQKKKVNAELSKQKAELENLNFVKDRLFSIIGHDLRSPLANLEAILSLMDSGDLGLDEVLNLTKKLTNDVQETSIMLENLLHWSNTQMKGIPPRYEDVELVNIARDTFTFLKPQSDKKSISLQISSQENCITFGDKEMIRLILRNLVANAIKFTPNEGLIKVEIIKLENEAKVSVIDNGIGIKDENLKKIFSDQPITTRGTQNEKGTGLGLMLCKDFVEKNKGRIWVTSELGKGSTFSFTIPLNMSIPEPNMALEEVHA